MPFLASLTALGQRLLKVIMLLEHLAQFRRH